MIKKIISVVMVCLIFILIAYFSLRPGTETSTFYTQVYTVGLTTAKAEEKLGKPHVVSQGTCTLSKGSSNKELSGEHWMYKFQTPSETLDINLCVYEGLVFSQRVIITKQVDGVVSTVTLNWVSSKLLDGVAKKKPFVFDLVL